VTQLFSKRFPLKRVKKSPFGYAVEYWIKHTKTVPQGQNATSASKDLWNIVMDFLWSGDAAFDKWVGVNPTKLIGDSSYNWKKNNPGPLHVAAAFDLADVLDYAHPAEVDFSVQDNRGWSPLLWTAYQGSLRALAVLIEREDLNVNAAEKNGWTALMVASRNGFETMVDLLLQVKDIDVNLKKNDGGYALRLAGAENQEGIVKLLQQHGARDFKNEPEQGDDIE